MEATGKCVKNVIENMIDGGYIYLDNSDVNKDASVSQDDPNFKTARQILMNYERTSGGGVIEYFRGLAPGVLFAQTGMLVKIRR